MTPPQSLKGLIGGAASHLLGGVLNIAGADGAGGGGGGSL